MAELSQESQLGPPVKREKWLPFTVAIVLLGLAVSCLFWRNHSRNWRADLREIVAMVRQSPAEREERKEGVIDFLHGSYWKETEGSWSKYGWLLFVSTSRAEKWSGSEPSEDTKNEVSVYSWNSRGRPNDLSCEFQVSERWASGWCMEGKGEPQLKGRSKNLCDWMVSITKIYDVRLEGNRILTEHSDLACEREYGGASVHFIWKLTQRPFR